MGEQAGQLLSTAAGFFDRLVLTAILLRIWNTETFETWSTLTAFATLASLFEFGFNLYFNNRITFQMERGDNFGAAHTYRVANTVLLASTVIGIAAMTFAASTLGPEAVRDDPLTALGLASLVLASFLRLMMAGPNALYRANRQYARLTLILTAGEFARIAGTMTAALIGGGIAGAGMAALGIQTIVFVYIAFIDTRRRYYPFGFGFAIPKGEIFREGLAKSTGYFSQLFPVILWTSLPILFLERESVAPGMLTSFIIIRTLSNVARTPLQSFGIVVGQEFGRRIAISDRHGAFRTFKQSARLFSVLAGIGVGMLIVGGEHVIAIWSGDASLFSLALLGVGLAPMLLAPVSLLAHNALLASNSPYIAAVARWFQVVLTALVWLAAPINDHAIRMMVALAVGEVAGYAPAAYFAVRRLIPEAGIGFHGRNVLLSLASAGFAAVITAAVLQLTSEMFNSSSSILMMIAFFIAGLLCSVFAIFAGFSKQGRDRLLTEMMTTRIVLRGMTGIGKTGGSGD
jgi:O-antigen/teichoic acid export membrane protein